MIKRLAVAVPSPAADPVEAARRRTRAQGADRRMDLAVGCGESKAPAKPTVDLPATDQWAQFLHLDLRYVAAVLTALALVSCGGGGGGGSAGLPVSLGPSNSTGSSGGPTTSKVGSAALNKPTPSTTLTLAILSSRADMVSGGDALVEVVLPDGIDAAEVRVTLNGEDVTAAFTAQASSRALRGLVTGLEVGDNHLTAKAGQGKDEASDHLKVFRRDAFRLVLFHAHRRAQGAC